MGWKDLTDNLLPSPCRGAGLFLGVCGASLPCAFPRTVLELSGAGPCWLGGGSESPQPPGATVGPCRALAASFVPKHLCPDLISGGVRSRLAGNPSVPFMKWFSGSALLEMNSQPPKHSCYKWDMCLGSSVPCIAGIFVHNCILFLVPLYNVPFSSSFFLRFSSAGLGCLCCSGIFGLPVLCSVHSLNQTRSAGRGEMCPAPGAALWPGISSALTLSWLGQCSELSSARCAAGRCRRHRAPRGKRAQLLAGASSCH